MDGGVDAWTDPAHLFYYPEIRKQLPHKVLAMDCRYPYLAIATSNKDVHIYNLAGGVRSHKAR